MITELEHRRAKERVRKMGLFSIERRRRHGGGNLTAVYSYLMEKYRPNKLRLF